MFALKVPDLNLIPDTSYDPSNPSRSDASALSTARCDPDTKTNPKKQNIKKPKK